MNKKKKNKFINNCNTEKKKYLIGERWVMWQLYIILYNFINIRSNTIICSIQIHLMICKRTTESVFNFSIYNCND